MYNKTFWLGFVIVFVVMLAIAYLVDGVLLQQHYETMTGVFRPDAEMQDMMWLLWVSTALTLYLFCRIFIAGYEGKGVGEGVRYGLLIGLFLSIPMALGQYVIYPITSAIATIWFVVGVISFVIGGAIFAAIYRPVQT